MPRFRIHSGTLATIRVKLLSSSSIYDQVQKQVLEGLQKGNDALEKANAVFSLDEIESIMSDTEDAVEKQREIERMLSGGLTEVSKFAIIFSRGLELNFVCHDLILLLLY